MGGSKTGKPAAAPVVVALLTCAVSALAQGPQSDSTLRFEVASIKPSASSTPFGISRPTNGVVRSRGAELRRLVAYAYGIDPASHAPQPQGGPDWIDDDLFAVEARGPAVVSIFSALQEQLGLKLQPRREPMEVVASSPSIG